MPNTQKGYAVLLTAGDERIREALAEGIEAGRAKAIERRKAAGQLPAPQAEADPAVLEADAVARRWLDGQRLKRTVGNHRTAEDYDHLITKARGDYGPRRSNPIARRLLVLAALLAIAAEAFFRWEETCWRGEGRP